jgi:hypothetical protein
VKYQISIVVSGCGWEGEWTPQLYPTKWRGEPKDGDLHYFAPPRDCLYLKLKAWAGMKVGMNEEGEALFNSIPCLLSSNQASQPA